MKKFIRPKETIKRKNEINLYYEIEYPTSDKTQISLNFGILSRILSDYFQLQFHS